MKPFIKKLATCLALTFVVGLGLLSPASAGGNGSGKGAAAPTQLELIDRILAKARPGQNWVLVGDFGLPVKKLQAYRDTLAKGNSKGVGASLAADFSAKLWPRGIVPYEFADDFPQGQRNDFLAACRELETFADLQFVVHTTEKDYVHVFQDPAVTNASYSSALGVAGGEQFFSLLPDQGIGTAEHELMHVLGIMHEQSRSDRDKYLTVNFGNIPTDEQSQFAIFPDSRNLGAYDFDSDMHYDQFAFSSNGQPVMTCKPGYEKYQNTMGTTRTMSPLDKAGLEALYGSKIKGYSVSGVVTSKLDNTPIVGARVTISTIGSVATTDDSGGYSFAIVPNGTYVLKASASGFVSASATVTVKGGPSGADFSLTVIPPTYGISGHITQDVGGSTVGVGGVLVAANGTIGTMTDADGNYQLPAQVAGTYTLSASKAFYSFTPLSNPTITLNGGGAIVDFTAQAAPDSDPPVVTIASPSNGSTQSFTTGNGVSVVATGTATDRSGVASLSYILTQQKGRNVQYYNWTTKKWTTKSTTPGLVLTRTMSGATDVTWSQLLPKLAAGTYTLTAWGTDGLGNESDGAQDTTSTFFVAKQKKVKGSGKFASIGVS